MLARESYLPPLVPRFILGVLPHMPELSDTATRDWRVAAGEYETIECSNDSRADMETIRHVIILLHNLYLNSQQSRLFP